MNAPLQLSRRDLLKGSSALVVAFSLAPQLEALAQDAAATKPVSLDQVDTFLAIDDKGMVTLYAGKVDLGTGVNIGLAQIVAEELDVPLANVSLVTGDTALTPDLWKPVHTEWRHANSSSGCHSAKRATGSSRSTPERGKGRSCN
jgi:nicotinate dehydrogenase subunit B